MKRHNLAFLIMTLGVWVLAARPTSASFDINLIFDDSYPPSQQSAAHQAELLWEDVITGYQPGITLTGVTVNLDTLFSDGVGSVLGQAFFPSTTWQGGFRLSTGGRFQIDPADMPSLESSGRLDDVIAHEIGHLLGVGMLWESNDLYENNSGEYTGSFGVAAYNAEFGQTGSFVPVELEGGSGTANAHWNEELNGARFTGIKDVMNRDFRDELMTGWLNSNPFLSNTTVQSMRDLGFTVVPEPIGLTTLLGGITIMVICRGRR